jgi:hypothetical protein
VCPAADIIGTADSDALADGVAIGVAIGAAAASLSWPWLGPLGVLRALREDTCVLGPWIAL